MSEHMTALDATFLELEEADESAHMHIGGIMVFEALKGGRTPTREQVCSLLGERLGSLPRYRQRLSQPHTGGLTWPAWEEDPDFDVARHISRAALPEPGGERELAEWASNFFSQRLDRHVPLWEAVLVEGLGGGRWALATKTHHCMVDGVGSVDVGYLLLDTERLPHRRRAAPEQVHGDDADPERGPLGTIAHAWGGLVPTESLGSVLALAHAGAHGVLHPREALSRARDGLRMVIDDEIRGAPHTSINRPIGTRRRLQVVRVPLAQLREIKQQLGGTVNDVVLTATASGLRALLQARGEEPPRQGLRAMVPMNLRTAEERLALGNKLSSLFVDLPVSDPRLLHRYRQTVRMSQGLKTGGRQAAGTSAVIDFASLAPPVLHAGIAQALYATRLFNVTITNVPGPQQTLYAFGAPLREIHPLVPLAAEHAVGIAVLSYDGEMFFGVVADRDSVPDLDVLTDALSESIRELLARARAERGEDARRAHTPARPRAGTRA